MDQYEVGIEDKLIILWLFFKCQLLQQHLTERQNSQLYFCKCRGLKTEQYQRQESTWLSKVK